MVVKYDKGIPDILTTYSYRLKTDNEGKINYFQFVKGFTKQLALTRGTKPEMTSVMKTDYCPPEERRYYFYSNNLLVDYHGKARLILSNLF